jgi:hypothetical protein
MLLSTPQTQTTAAGTEQEARKQVGQEQMARLSSRMPQGSRRHSLSMGTTRCDQDCIVVKLEVLWCGSVLVLDVKWRAWLGQVRCGASCMPFKSSVHLICLAAVVQYSNPSSSAEPFDDV